MWFDKTIKRWHSEGLPEEKLSAVLEGIKGVKSVSEICRDHHISQSLFYRWRDKFLEGGKKGLVNGVKTDNSHKAE